MSIQYGKGVCMNSEFERQIKEIVALPDYSDLDCELKEGRLLVRRIDGNRLQFEKSIWKLKEELAPIASRHGLNVYGDGGRMSIGKDGSFAFVFTPKDAKASSIAQNMNEKWKQ